MKFQFIKNSVPLYFFLIVVSTVVFVALIFSNDTPGDYSFIWVLPLVYIISLLPIMVSRQGGIALYKLIIIIIYFLRMTISPFVMMIGGYDSVIDVFAFSKSIYLAIFLISYENIVVFYFLEYISRNDYKVIKNKPYVSLKKLKSPSSKLKLLIIAFISIALVILAKDPTIAKHTFLYILDDESSYYALSDTNKGVGSLSMYVVILSSIFKILQITLPPFILYYILKLKSKQLRIIYSLILTSLVCLIATEDRIDALLAGFAFLMTLRTVLGAKFEKNSKLILGIVAGICFIGLAIKGGAFSNEANSNGKFSSTMVAYFSGIPTVATGIDFIESKSENSLYFFQIVPDIISKIPFLSYSIKYFSGITILNSNQLFNEYISNLIGYNIGQILPTTVVGYNYFGFLLAPIFPCLLILLARYYWKKTFVQSNLIIRNLFFWITISVSLSPVVMSGMLIVGKLSWFYISYFLIKIFDK